MWKNEENTSNADQLMSDYDHAITIITHTVNMYLFTVFIIITALGEQMNISHHKSRTQSISNRNKEFN